MTLYNLSEEIKSAIVNHANEWAITNFHALEKLRRNLLIGCVVISLLGLTGIPESIEFIGIEFNRAPNFLFYIMSILIIIYLYWSYHSVRKSADLLGTYLRKVHNDVIEFDLWIEQIFNPKNKQTTRSIYRIYMPALAAFLSLMTVLVRMVIELVPSPKALLCGFIISPS